MIFKNSVYDKLKWVSSTFIPALIVFYGTIGSACNIPYLETTLIIMGAFDTFLGTLLGISSIKYAKLNETTESEEK